MLGIAKNMALGALRATPSDSESESLCACACALFGARATLPAGRIPGRCMLVDLGRASLSLH